MISHPERLIKDWADYRPDNRNWFRAHGCLTTILIWCAFWGLAIWLSCR